MRNLIRSIVISALAISAAACQPKNESVDQRQTQINVGNASLARMEDLKEDLLANGISIDRPAMSKNILRAKTLPQLQIIRAKLEEFITHGQNVLTVSMRSDVTWADHQAVEDRLAAAQSLLAIVNQQIAVQGGQITAQFDTQFWMDWSECRSTNINGFEYYGIRVWHGFTRWDDRTIRVWSRSERREALTRLRLQQRCNAVLAQGNTGLFGSTYIPKARVIDAPSEFESYKPEDKKSADKNIEGLVKKLSEADDKNSNVPKAEFRR